MPTAVCLIRDLPHYRRAAFEAGLAACGYVVTAGGGHAPGPDDVLVIWNRYGTGAAVAARFEAAGRPVLVSENGYLGADAQGRQLYALALRHHNGAGDWRPEDDGGARWRQLGLDIAPWRPGGDEVVVLPQRGIGPEGVAMPHGWGEQVLRALKGRGVRARIRPHPGKDAPPVDLATDLAAADSVVTWGSGAGLKALLWGVPVFHGLASWIGAPAARHWRIGDGIDDPQRSLDRRRCFHRLAWAQWTVDELASGRPFARLLRL